MNLQPKQNQALETLLNPKCKYELYGGAMAGGKSYVLRWAALYFLLWLFKKTGIRHIPVGLFSEDYPTLKDRQISRILREFPVWLGSLRETKGEGFAYFIDEQYGGGRLLLRNLDDPSKYLSSEFAGIFVEEMTRNPEVTFHDLRNRLRYPGIDDVKFMGTSNPGGIGHEWVKRYYIHRTTDDPEQDRFFYVPATVYDNKYVSKEYIKQLEALPEDKRRAYLEGSWDIFAGQYFPEWKRVVHTCSPFNPKAEFPKIGGMDWGYTAPFCFLSAFIQKVNFEGVSFRRLWTYRELYGIERAPRDWADEIKTKNSLYQYVYVVADPSMFNKRQDGSRAIVGDFIDSWGKFGYKVKPANNKRKPGWAMMRNWLSIAPDGLPYWIISDNCVNLIRELENAIRDDVDVEDIDAKCSDHALDAARYLQSRVQWIDAKTGYQEKKEMVSLIPAYRSTMNLNSWEISGNTLRSWKSR